MAPRTYRPSARSKPGSASLICQKRMGNFLFGHSTRDDLFTHKSYDKFPMPIRYSHEIPVNQLGRSENVWVSREYGLYLVWVRRESTVTSADSFTSYVQLHARIKIAFSSGTTCEGHR